MGIGIGSNLPPYFSVPIDNRKRLASWYTSDYGQWLLAQHPHDLVLREAVGNPALTRIVHDMLARDESWRFRISQLCGLLFDDAADATCLQVIEPLIVQAYQKNPTFRRLFNWHVEALPGVRCRLSAADHYSVTVTEKQTESALGCAMTLVLDADGAPQALGDISPQCAMMYVVLLWIMGLGDDASTPNYLSAVNEYANIIGAEMFGQAGRAAYGVIVVREAATMTCLLAGDALRHEVRPLAAATASSAKRARETSPPSSSPLSLYPWGETLEGEIMQPIIRLVRCMDCDRQLLAPLAEPLIEPFIGTHALAPVVTSAVDAMALSDQSALPLDLKVRFTAMLAQLRGATWDGDVIDLAVNTIVNLPDWPQHRILLIEDALGQPHIALVPPGHPRALDGRAYHRERIKISLPEQLLADAVRVKKVLTAEGLEHYNAIVDGNAIPIAADGHCFFRAVLAAKGHDASDHHVMALRKRSADYLQQHAQEYAAYLGNDESSMPIPSSATLAVVSKASGSTADSSDSEQQIQDAVQQWELMTHDERKIGVFAYAEQKHLPYKQLRTYIFPLGLTFLGQQMADKGKLIDYQDIKVDLLEQWGAMNFFERKKLRAENFSRQHNWCPGRAQYFISLRGIKHRGRMFIDKQKGRIYTKLNTGHLLKWNAMTEHERKRLGQQKFSDQNNIEISTLYKFTCMTGTGLRGCGKNYLRKRGIHYFNAVTENMLQELDNKIKKMEALSFKNFSKKNNLDIVNLMTFISAAGLTARGEAVLGRGKGCIDIAEIHLHKWLALTQKERLDLGVIHFVRRENLDIRNIRCFTLKGLSHRGRALLNRLLAKSDNPLTMAVVKQAISSDQELPSPDHVWPMPITKYHLKRWLALGPTERENLSIVGFARQENLSVMSTTKFLRLKGLSHRGNARLKRIAHKKYYSRMPKLIEEWMAIPLSERNKKRYLDFAQQHNMNSVAMQKYVGLKKISPLGRALLDQAHTAKTDVPVSVIATSIVVKQEPASLAEPVQIINSHIYDNTFPYVCDADQLEIKQGRKLTIKMGPYLNDMLAALPPAERKAHRQSIIQQLNQWLSDQGSVAAERLDHLMEVAYPVDDGPERDDTVFAKQDIEKFQVIGFYAGKLLNFSDGSYSKECREQGARNIESYAFGVANRNAVLSAYRAGNILSKINSVQPDQKMKTHPAWEGRLDNLQACAAGTGMIFLIALEKIRAGQELLLNYGDQYRMFKHQPIIVKIEQCDDAEDVPLELVVPRIKNRSEIRGEKLTATATELPFLRKLPSESDATHVLFHPGKGWYKLDRPSARQNALPRRYRTLAPQLMLDAHEQYYFYYARCDVYLPLTPGNISSKWLLQTPDGDATGDVLDYVVDGDSREWRYGKIVLHKGALGVAQML